MKIVGAVIGVLALMLGLTWVIQGSDFFMYRFFAPKYEQVRRQVFEQSKAYNQGMIQQLEQERMAYETADDAHKAALAAMILHEQADYDQDKLPPYLQDFVTKLRNTQEVAH